MRVGASFVQHHADLCAHPGRVAAGGCRTIEEIAEQRTLDPGVQQSLQHVGGVAAPAAAGIVGDVGQAHGGAAPFPPGGRRARDGLVERREACLEAIAFGPGELRELPGDLPGLRPRAVRQDRDSRFRRIGERESAQHRHHRQISGDVALPLDDHVGVRAARRQQRYRGSGDRHADEDLFEALAGEEPPHDGSRFAAALALVDVRVRAIGDDHVGAVHHALRDVGVEIDGRDDRLPGPDRLARERVECAVGVAVGGRDHRAVVADVYAIERSAPASNSRMRASVRSMNAESAGPPGSVAVTRIGTASHEPAAFMAAMKPGISPGMAGAAFAASASMASPSR